MTLLAFAVEMVYNRAMIGICPGSDGPHHPTFLRTP